VGGGSGSDSELQARHNKGGHGGHGAGPGGHGSAAAVPVDASRGYEARDVGISTLVKWWLGLGGFIFVCLLLAWGVYFAFVPREDELEMAFPMSVQRRLPPEPNPILQARPLRDMREFRQAENEALQGYGWADKNAGTARIPVDRALELTAQQGLPARSRQPAQVVYPTEVGDDVESGQISRFGRQNENLRPLGTTTK
jgi:hypothetical protein